MIPDTLKLLGDLSQIANAVILFGIIPIVRMSHKLAVIEALMEEHMRNHG